MFVKWCESNGRTLVSATEPFDLGTPLGRILVVLLAAFGEMELQAMKERALSSHAELRQTTRWAGGAAPFGYITIKNPNGDGKVLVPDAEAVPIINNLFDLVIEGKSPKLYLRADEPIGRPFTHGPQY